MKPLILLDTVYPETKWKIVSEAPRVRYGSGTCYVAWNVICECGTPSVVTSTALQTGRSKQCRKCSSKLASQKSAKVQTKHGHSPFGSHGRRPTPTYNSWYAMKARCSNPKNKRWDAYGGRGIQVCERWLDFTNFLEDMGVRPENKTLDRVNVNGNYTPKNCRWADNKTQRHNRRDQRSENRSLPESELVAI